MDPLIPCTYANNSVFGIQLLSNPVRPIGFGYYVQVTTPSLSGLLTLTFHWTDDSYTPRSKTVGAISLLDTNTLNDYFVVDAMYDVTMDIVISGLINIPLTSILSEPDYFYTVGHK